MAVLSILGLLGCDDPPLLVLNDCIAEADGDVVDLSRVSALEFVGNGTWFSFGGHWVWTTIDQRDRPALLKEWKRCRTP